MKRDSDSGEQTIAALTAELDTTKKHLAQANFELEHLTFIASHDLQEPLRQIHILAAQITASQHDPDFVNEQLTKIATSSARMTSLIGNVLEYSRLSKGNPTFESVDLNEVLADILSDLAPDIAAKAAVVETEHLPAIFGVPHQLDLLLRNLIGNALRFSGQTPRISIQTIEMTPELCERAALIDAPEQYAAIRIKDNGIGFDPSYASDIFRFFFRLENPANAEGNGIGLALCKKIVDNHGGYIEAMSQPGEGAEFRIVLSNAVVE